jgi:hypothetical protein
MMALPSTAMAFALSLVVVCAASANPIPRAHVGSWAAPQAAQAGQAKPKAEKTCVGDAVTIDVAAKTMKLKGKQAEMTFDVAFAQYATGTKLEELKVGDRVGIEYVVKDAKSVATLVAKIRKRPDKTPEPR